MNRIKLVLSVCLMLFVSSVQAENEGRNLLEKFLQTTSSLHAKFEQRLVDSRGFLLQKSSGIFTLKRPGRFIWDYSIPYEQKIVSNGEKIWIYDAELEQVSVKKYDQILTGAPVILLDQKKDMDEEFTVSEQGLKEGVYWVLLVPKSTQSDFKEIVIGMTSNGLHTMKFVDNFEQSTTIEFDSLKLNQQLDDSLFKFIPPLGTDVVGDY